jgi:hypothetical protein
MTTTTTFPTDSTSVPSIGRRSRGAAAGVALGVALGWFASAALTDDPAATAEPTAAVVDVVPSPLVMSPDAMARWAEADALVVSPLVMSPDAMARRAEADAARQARVDHAACERLSQGLADC